jgi:hypothetical protein
MLSPQSVLGAASNPPTTLGLLAERLTCLELHFDDPTDLDIRMRELSSLSKAIFTAAKNIEAVHIGFPSHRPLNLRLEEIFHNVKWDKLQAFGIQAWKLDADEIIALARRHQGTLRGLRLRDVLLKDGSRWKDVLGFLRDSMTKLDWVSLRRIDYARHFDDSRVLGAEIPDEPLVGSDSSDESDEYDEYDNDDDAPNHYPDDMADGSNGSMPDSDLESDGGTDEPEQGGLIHLPQTYPDTPVSVHCCNEHMDSVEALGDEGTYVTNAQRYNHPYNPLLPTLTPTQKMVGKMDCQPQVSSPPGSLNHAHTTRAPSHQTHDPPHPVHQHTSTRVPGLRTAVTLHL